MSLYPTPTRLRLLGEVERGIVLRWLDAGNEDRDAFGYRCNAALFHMRKAGWVDLGQPAQDGLAADVRPWFITEAGRAVLAKAATR